MTEEQVAPQPLTKHPNQHPTNFDLFDLTPIFSISTGLTETPTVHVPGSAYGISLEDPLSTETNVPSEEKKNSHKSNWIPLKENAAVGRFQPLADDAHSFSSISLQKGEEEPQGEDGANMQFAKNPQNWLIAPEKFTFKDNESYFISKDKNDNELTEQSAEDKSIEGFGESDGQANIFSLKPQVTSPSNSEIAKVSLTKDSRPHSPTSEAMLIIPPKKSDVIGASPRSKNSQKPKASSDLKETLKKNISLTVNEENSRESEYDAENDDQSTSEVNNTSYRGTPITSAAQTPTAASQAAAASGNNEKNQKPVCFRQVVSGGENGQYQVIVALCSNDTIIVRFFGPNAGPIEREDEIWLPKPSVSGGAAKPGQTPNAGDFGNGAGYVPKIGPTSTPSVSSERPTSPSEDECKSEKIQENPTLSAFNSIKTSKKLVHSSPIIRVIDFFQKKRLKILKIALEESTAATCAVLTNSMEVYVIPICKAVFNFVKVNSWPFRIVKDLRIINKNKKTEKEQPSEEVIKDLEYWLQVYYKSQTNGSLPSLKLYTCFSTQSEKQQLQTKTFNFLSSLTTIKCCFSPFVFPGNNGMLDELPENAPPKPATLYNLTNHGKITCVSWWRTFDQKNYLILGTSYGFLLFLNMENGSQECLIPLSARIWKAAMAKMQAKLDEKSDAKISEIFVRLTELQVLESSQFKILLISVENGTFWKLLLEEEESKFPGSFKNLAKFYKNFKMNSFFLKNKKHLKNFFRNIGSDASNREDRANLEDLEQQFYQKNAPYPLLAQQRDFVNEQPIDPTNAAKTPTSSAPGAGGNSKKSKKALHTKFDTFADFERQFEEEKAWFKPSPCVFLNERFPCFVNFLGFDDEEETQHFLTLLSENSTETDDKKIKEQQQKIFDFQKRGSQTCVYSIQNNVFELFDPSVFYEEFFFQQEVRKRFKKISGPGAQTVAAQAAAAQAAGAAVTTPGAQPPPSSFGTDFEYDDYETDEFLEYYGMPRGGGSKSNQNITQKPNYPSIISKLFFGQQNDATFDNYATNSSNYNRKQARSLNVFPNFSFSLSSNSVLVYPTKHVLFTVQKPSRRQDRPYSTLIDGKKNDFSPYEEEEGAQEEKTEKIWVVSRSLATKQLLDNKNSGSAAKVLGTPSNSAGEEEESNEELDGREEDSLEQIVEEKEKKTVAVFQDFDLPEKQRILGFLKGFNYAKSQIFTPQNKAPENLETLNLFGVYFWSQNTIFEMKAKRSPQNLFLNILKHISTTKPASKDKKDLMFDKNEEILEAENAEPEFENSNLKLSKFDEENAGAPFNYDFCKNTNTFNILGCLNLPGFTKVQNLMNSVKQQILNKVSSFSTTFSDLHVLKLYEKAGNYHFFEALFIKFFLLSKRMVYESEKKDLVASHFEKAFFFFDLGDVKPGKMVERMLVCILKQEPHNFSNFIMSDPKNKINLEKDSCNLPLEQLLDDYYKSEMSKKGSFFPHNPYLASLISEPEHRNCLLLISTNLGNFDTLGLQQIVAYLWLLLEKKAEALSTLEKRSLSHLLILVCMAICLQKEQEHNNELFFSESEKTTTADPFDPVWKWMKHQRKGKNEKIFDKIRKWKIVEQPKHLTARFWHFFHTFLLTSVDYDLHFVTSVLITHNYCYLALEIAHFKFKQNFGHFPAFNTLFEELSSYLKFSSLFNQNQQVRFIFMYFFVILPIILKTQDDRKLLSLNSDCSTPPSPTSNSATQNSSNFSNPNANTGPSPSISAITRDLFFPNQIFQFIIQKNYAFFLIFNFLFAIEEKNSMLRKISDGSWASLPPGIATIRENPVFSLKKFQSWIKNMTNEKEIGESEKKFKLFSAVFLTPTPFVSFSIWFFGVWKVFVGNFLNPESVPDYDMPDFQTNKFLTRLMDLSKKPSPTDQTTPAGTNDVNATTNAVDAKKTKKPKQKVLLEHSTFFFNVFFDSFFNHWKDLQNEKLNTKKYLSTIISQKWFFESLFVRKLKISASLKKWICECGNIDILEKIILPLFDPRTTIFAVKGNNNSIFLDVDHTLDEENASQFKRHMEDSPLFLNPRNCYFYPGISAFETVELYICTLLRLHYLCHEQGQAKIKSIKFFEKTLKYYLKNFPNFYEKQDVLDLCITLKNKLALKIVFETHSMLINALEICLYELETQKLENDQLVQAIFNLFERYILPMKKNSNNGNEAQIQAFKDRDNEVNFSSCSENQKNLMILKIFNFWAKFSLPLNKLESFLLDNLSFIGENLCALLLFSNVTQVEIPFHLSEFFALKLLEHYVKKIYAEKVASNPLIQFEIGNNVIVGDINEEKDCKDENKEEVPVMNEEMIQSSYNRGVLNLLTQTLKTLDQELEKRRYFKMEIDNMDPKKKNFVFAMGKILQMENWETELMPFLNPGGTKRML